MIQTIRKAWGIPELRKKIIFTLLILLIFRIGNAITVPYVDVSMLETYLDQMGGTILGLYNVMSGGAAEKDQQDEECKDDLFPQLGDAPRLANRLDHVTSPRPFRQLPR